MTMRICLLVLNFIALINSINAVAGVNYGTIADNLPSPSQAVQIIKSSNAGFDRVKIFSYSTDIISALASAGGLKLAIAIPNDELLSFAGGSTASDWVRQVVAPFSSVIDLVVVGNEVNRGGDLNTLLAAMTTLHSALQQQGLSNSIRLTTPFSADVLQASFPPSSGAFDPKVSQLLQFLNSNNSPLMINVYPYFSWQGDPNSIQLDYALFRSSSIVIQDGQYAYSNLFDAIVDAAVAAMEKAGMNRSSELIVGESGWPSGGGVSGADAGNAQQYNSALLRKLREGQGTPRRQRPITAYVFALFNEDRKAAGVEQHWGLYNADGSPAYQLNL